MASLSGGVVALVLLLALFASPTECEKSGKVMPTLNGNKMQLGVDRLKEITHDASALLAHVTASQQHEWMTAYSEFTVEELQKYEYVLKDQDAEVAITDQDTWVDIEEMINKKNPRYRLAINRPSIVASDVAMMADVHNSFQCSMTGDPHYHTFQGEKHHSMDHCPRVLMFHKADKKNQLVVVFSVTETCCCGARNSWVNSCLIELIFVLRLAPDATPFSFAFRYTKPAGWATVYKELHWTFRAFGTTFSLRDKHGTFKGYVKNSFSWKIHVKKQGRSLTVYYPQIDMQLYLNYHDVYFYFNKNRWGKPGFYISGECGQTDPNAQFSKFETPTFSKSGKMEEDAGAVNVEFGLKINPLLFSSRNRFPVDFETLDPFESIYRKEGKRYYGSRAVADCSAGSAMKSDEFQFGQGCPDDEDVATFCNKYFGLDRIVEDNEPLVSGVHALTSCLIDTCSCKDSAITKLRTERDAFSQDCMAARRVAIAFQREVLTLMGVTEDGITCTSSTPAYFQTRQANQERAKLQCVGLQSVEVLSVKFFKSSDQTDDFRNSVTDGMPDPQLITKATVKTSKAKSVCQSRGSCEITWMKASETEWFDRVYLNYKCKCEASRCDLPNWEASATQSVDGGESITCKCKAGYAYNVATGACEEVTCTIPTDRLQAEYDTSCVSKKPGEYCDVRCSGVAGSDHQVQCVSYVTPDNTAVAVYDLPKCEVVFTEFSSMGLISTPTVEAFGTLLELNGCYYDSDDHDSYSLRIERVPLEDGSKLLMKFVVAKVWSQTTNSDRDMWENESMVATVLSDIQIYSKPDHGTGGFHSHHSTDGVSVSLWWIHSDGTQFSLTRGACPEETIAVGPPVDQQLSK